MSTNNSLNLNTVTPLIVGYGGTGANNAASARTNLGAAASGANSDITSLTGLTGVIQGPTFINDSNGNEILDFYPVSSAVNYYRITNESTGKNPLIAALGSDTNVSVDLLSKGTAPVIFETTGTLNQLYVISGTAYANTAILNFPNSVGPFVYSYPNATGTIALTGSASSGYVLLAPAGPQTITGQNLTLSGASFSITGSGSLTIASGNITNTLGDIVATNGNVFATVGGFVSGSNGGGYAGTFETDAPSLNSGKNIFMAANNSGAFTNTLINASTTADRTWTLPDATGTVIVADANSNVSANSFINGFATTVTAAANTTLVVGSPYQQFFTGSTTQSVIMPVTSTLTVGQSWLVVNNSSGVVTVKSSGSNNIIAMASGTNSIITCIAQTGTTAADWNAENLSGVAGVDSITGTANQIIASSPTGTVTLSLPQSIATTSAVTFGSVAFSPTTQGIVGTTTNDSVSAGYVGEYINSTILFSSSISLTTTQNANLTSISLSAGDWDVWGNIYSVTTTSTNYLISSALSLTSVTMPDQAYISTTATLIPALTSVAIGITTPDQRISVGTTTTVYLVVQGTFTGTATVCGGIYARRVR